MTWTYRLLLLTILLLPWYNVRSQVVGIPVTLLEVSSLATLLIGAVEWVRSDQPWHSLQKIVSDNRWWLLWTGLLAVSALLATIFAPDTRAALGFLKAYIIEPIAIGWLVLLVVGNNRSRWWGIVTALMAAGLEVVAVGISQWLWGWPNWAPAELSQGRISSVYNSANRVALFLGPLIGLILPAIMRRHDKARWLWIPILAVVGMLLAMWLSHSRGGFIGLAALVIPWLALALQQWKKNIFSTTAWKGIWLAGILGYVVACLAFVWFINKPPVVDNPWARSNFTTFTIRQCVWQGTKAMLSERPITGAGLAGFTTEYIKHYTCDAEPLEDPHMLVLNFWSETGLLGLVSIVGLIVVWGWQALKFLTSKRPWVGIALISPLVYILAHGLLDIPYFRNDLSMEWWVLAGLAMAAQKAWLKE